MSIKLIRTTFKKDRTIGVMIVNNQYPAFYTLELPWQNNERNISCIPEGEYECIKTETTKVEGGKTFKVDHVPGRSHILFHVGNTAEDTKGCILVGSHVTPEWNLGMSRIAMQRFLKMLSGKHRVKLELIDA